MKISRTFRKKEKKTFQEMLTSHRGFPKITLSRYEAIWGRGRCEMSETLLILGYLGYRVHLRSGPSYLAFTSILNSPLGPEPTVADPVIGMVAKKLYHSSSRHRMHCYFAESS